MCVCGAGGCCPIPAFCHFPLKWAQDLNLPFKNPKRLSKSALTLPTNTEWAWSRRYLLKSGFVYFLPLSPSVLFEAAELLTQSLTFCAFKGILGCCRKPRDWTTSRRLREISTSTIYHLASEKANFRLNSKHKTHLFRRKMAEAACFVIIAETEIRAGPSRLCEGLLSHLPEIQ